MLNENNKKWVEYLSKLVNQSYEYTLNKIILKNNPLTNKPLTQIKDGNITELFLDNLENKIENFELFGLTNIEYLRIGNSNISKIIFKEDFLFLQFFSINNSKVKILENLENLENLKVLDLFNNQVELLDISNNIKLEVLQVFQPNLNKSFQYDIDLVKNVNIKYLHIDGKLIIIRN
jgi:Leucine-rich repeat (LRR) protein